MGGHNKIKYSVLSVLDGISIFKFSIQQVLLDHFMTEGQELYKKFKKAGMPGDWWKKIEIGDVYIDINVNQNWIKYFIICTHS